MVKTKLKPPEGEGINMTPMIDVVFQLLIFFMLCSDMSNNEAVDLVLPRVSEAVPDQGEPDRQTINVDKAGHIFVGQFQVDIDTLDKEVLKLEAALRQKKGSNFSEKPILIRADSQAQFGIIQEIMARCVKRKIYKLAFAAKLGGEETTSLIRGMN